MERNKPKMKMSFDKRHEKTKMKITKEMEQRLHDTLARLHGKTKWELQRTTYNDDLPLENFDSKVDLECKIWEDWFDDDMYLFFIAQIGNLHGDFKKFILFESTDEFVVSFRNPKILVRHFDGYDEASLYLSLYYKRVRSVSTPSRL